MSKPSKPPVNRRNFLKGAAAGAAAIVAEPALAATPEGALPAPLPSSAVQVGDDGTRYASDYMVDLFKSLGIEYVLAMPAGNFAGLIESVAHYAGNSNPEWITCMHEESSVAMANGYAKIEGKPVLVCAHATVGLQHATMGIYDAWCDRVPIYMVLGNTQDATQRGGYVTWVHSAQDPCGLVRDITKWDDNPISTAHFAESAVRAYKIATTPPMGPVALVLDEHRHLERVPANMRIPTLSVPTAPQGDASAVAEAARLLVAARNPVITVGRTARTPAGVPLLVELAETLQAGVVDRWHRRMNFPSRHPLNGGDLNDADVILALEAGDIAGMARQAKQRDATVINVSDTELYLKSNYQDFFEYAEVDLSISGDAEATLPTLIESVKRLITPNRRVAFEARGRTVAAANRQALDRERIAATHGWDASPISTARLSMELWEQIKNEDWSYVSGWVTWPLRLWDFDKHYQFIGRAGGEGIGYHLPATIGAALANKKYGRLTVSINGDGDFMVANGALWTAAHHQIPILIIMQNNRAYHQDYMDMDRIAHVRDRGSSSTMGIGTEITNPDIDYAQLAQSLGVAAEGPISDPRDLAAAIRRGIEVVKGGQPYLIDAITQPR